jgi:hypothetical protein
MEVFWARFSCAQTSLSIVVVMKIKETLFTHTSPNGLGAGIFGLCLMLYISCSPPHVVLSWQQYLDHTWKPSFCEDMGSFKQFRCAAWSLTMSQKLRCHPPAIFSLTWITEIESSNDCINTRMSSSEKKLFNENFAETSVAVFEES